MFVFQNKKRQFSLQKKPKIKKIFTLQTTVWQFWFSCGTPHIVDGPTDPVSCVIQRFPRLHRFLFSFSGTTEPPGDNRITLVAHQEHRRTVVNVLPHFEPERSHSRSFSRTALSLSFLCRHPGRIRVEARAHWFSLTSELGRN